MAAKPPAPAAPADAAPAKPKSKKRLIIILAAVVAIVLVAVAVLVALMMFQPAADELGPDGLPLAPETAAAAPATPPTFMPLENMVVNLADPGAMRFAQIGITVQLADSATADRLTAFMPAIRNGMLRLTSQRTATELLTPAGKDALAADILGMIRTTTGLPDSGASPSPVQAVLFTSLIVQ